MATRPGFGKRIREREKEQERKAKAAKRQQRREDRNNRPDDFDPYQIVKQDMPEDS
jgi:hypothetical protein